MYIVNTEKVQEDTECIICEGIMQYVEKVMNSRSSKDEIEHLIHGVCNHLPQHMSIKCNNFVNEYAEIVIELLTQEVSPKEICTIVGLCKAEATKIEGISEPVNNDLKSDNNEFDNVESKNDDLKVMARMNIPSVIMV